MNTLLPALLLCLTAFSARAHDVWVGTDLRILFGHPDQGAEPYAPEKVVEVRLQALDGSLLPHALIQEQDHAQIRADQAPALAWVYFDNGFYSKTPDAGRFQPGKLPNATEVKQFIKYGKTLYAWSPRAAEPSGWGLELVPEMDPATLKPGAPLPMSVYFNGERLRTAKVARYVEGAETVYEPDAQGRVTVPYMPGDQVIYTTRHSLAGTDGVDEISVAGALMLAPR